MLTEPMVPTIPAGVMRTDDAALLARFFRAVPVDWSRVQLDIRKADRVVAGGQLVPGPTLRIEVVVHPRLQPGIAALTVMHEVIHAYHLCATEETIRPLRAEYLSWRGRGGKDRWDNEPTYRGLSRRSEQALSEWLAFSAEHFFCHALGLCPDALLSTVPLPAASGWRATLAAWLGRMETP
jgi:hypothetical protein